MKRMLVVMPPGETPEGFMDAALMRAKESGAEVLAVYVVDSLWSRYSGADWLSDGPSRAGFDSYMRDTLTREGEVLLDGLAAAAKEAGLAFRTQVIYGDPAEAVHETAGSFGADEIIAPSSHPWLKDLKKKSPCPIIACPLMPRPQTKKPAPPSGGAGFESPPSCPAG